MREFSDDENLNIGKKFGYMVFNFVRGIIGYKTFLKTRYWPAENLEQGSGSPSQKYLNQFLRKKIREIFPSGEIKVLDIGCGSGHIRKLFYNLGYKVDYTGVDVLTDSHFEDSNKYSSQSKFINSAIEDFETEEKYDFVFFVASLEHIKEDFLAVTKTLRFLKPSGIQIQIVPSFWSLFLYLWHGYRQYTPSRFKKMLKRKNIEVYRLGGLFSFLAHLFFITILEVVLGIKFFRKLNIYSKIINIANRLDRFIPFFSASYAVIVRNSESESITLTGRIKWRLQRLFSFLRNLLSEPKKNIQLTPYFLSSLLPSSVSSLKDKICRNYINSFICQNLNPDEFVLDFRLFKVVAKEPFLAPVTRQFLDLVYPYLVKIKHPLIIAEGPYEKDQVKLKPGDTVIDAGSYLGVFSLFASQKVGPKGKVYAFEPIIENRSLLEKSIKLNKITNIEVVPFALGSSQEDLLMSVEDDKFNKSSGFSGKGAKRSVKQTSLDKFIEERNIARVDFIKADIEGMEREMLQGAKKTIKESKPNLAICTYHRSDDPKVLEIAIRSFDPNYQVIHTQAKLYAHPAKIRIIGICLVKDEDLYIERVLKNIINFCDEIIVLDNMSHDYTFEKIKNLQSPKIKLFKIEDAFRSHRFIEKYAGTNTWIFGVDGDEIYDPIGLEKLRQEILSGKYQDKWSIWGDSLNCLNIDLASGKSLGYLAPPSRRVTKLFNFSLLESWQEKYSQRLHGTGIIFKQGFDNSLQDKICGSWEECYFRALHLCFMNRTSLKKAYRNVIRLSPEERSRLLPLARNFISNLLNGKISLASGYKLRKYQKGELIEKDIRPFFYESKKI